MIRRWDDFSMIRVVPDPIDARENEREVAEQLPTDSGAEEPGP